MINDIKYKSGNRYWFYEFYNNTGRILNGELIWKNEHGNVKILAENGNYWYLSAKRLFDSKENLIASKEKGMKKENELGK